MGKKIEEMANMQIGGFSLCKIVALGGAALLFLSFFMPWWGISIERKGDNATADLAREESLEAARYRAFLGGKDEISESAWGWDFSRAIVTFVFSFLIAGAVAAVMLVPQIRPYGMFMLLFAACLALVVFIMSLTVWFGTPGDNLTGGGVEVAQGVSVGPFIALLGSLAVLAGAGYEGVIGLLGFLKAKPAA
jgi:hypothetical protein